MAIRKTPQLKLTATERAAALTPHAVRTAARRFREDGRVPPPGLRHSRVHDVWIDLGDGAGPEAYPPKVILTLATDGQLPKKEGYVHGGIWTTQLRDLGFPVLPKGKRPKRGQDCRGIESAPENRRRVRGTAAKSLSHVGAYRALAAEHLRAAAVADSEIARQPDNYDIWVDGVPYPFWPVFRAAVKVVGGVTRQRPRQRVGHQPEHELVRQLGFDVLPGGLAPVPICAGTAPVVPAPNAVTVPALKRAAELLDQAPEFRARREGYKFDLWVEGEGPYPIKAMCLLAFHTLGLGWHEGDWRRMGGAKSQMFRHLHGLPGVQILAKGDLPDEDGGRARRLAEDLKEIERSDIPETTRKRLTDARLGQGRYRVELSAHWRGVCSVTGVGQNEVLRASHIVPWRKDVARLDPHNGLLLVATLDCLFDRGLISFAKDGALIVGKVRPEDRAELGLNRALRLSDTGLTTKRLEYLEWHRKEYGFPND